MRKNRRCRRPLLLLLSLLLSSSLISASLSKWVLAHVAPRGFPPRASPPPQEVIATRLREPWGMATRDVFDDELNLLRGKAWALCGFDVSGLKRKRVSIRSWSNVRQPV
ncbi:hypothetical protein H4582DRAFT_2057680 [Lactarius indigo]|nr:hypothetical protein H4582DRAFT_2057680 [Lactarius indigo]